jgi:hypothetical protein
MAEAVLNRLRIMPALATAKAQPAPHMDVEGRQSYSHREIYLAIADRVARLRRGNQSAARCRDLIYRGLELLGGKTSPSGLG